MRVMFAVFLVASVLALARPASADRAKEVERIEAASEVFTEIMAVPEKSIPNELLQKAECVVIVPSMKKGGFLVGAQYGRGVVTCRSKGRRYGPPSMLQVAGGSIGLQIGGQAVDILMLIMNPKGKNFLVRDKFTVGADASAAAGPVGRLAAAETNAAMRAEILTYSRARGLFAGVTLKGSSVKPDNDGNRDLYGREITARQILLEGNAPVPPEASKLLNALAKYR